MQSFIDPAFTQVCVWRVCVRSRLEREWEGRKKQPYVYIDSGQNVLLLCCFDCQVSKAWRLKHARTHAVEQARARPRTHAQSHRLRERTLGTNARYVCLVYIRTCVSTTGRNGTQLWRSPAFSHTRTSDSWMRSRKALSRENTRTTRSSTRMYPLPAGSSGYALLF